MPNKTAFSYKDAGVDIDASNAFVERLKPAAKKTKRSEVIGGLGGFGALCNIPQHYHEPVLVASTDGVGTKLRLAIDAKSHRSIGIDLVAMCVNDLIVQGAEPLFFLDYYAAGKLNVDVAVEVVSGIAEGCLQSGCSLIGGETAEMPGMYANNDYDIAGFSVGVVEKSDIIDGSRVKVGDALIAISSSGPHANGYSLIRKIVEEKKINLHTTQLDNTPLIDHLLAPTRIYAKPVLRVVKQFDVHAIAHITGGGFWENIPRVLPENCQAIIDAGSWQWPPLFHWLQEMGNITQHEMYRTFNCGVGMIIVLPKEDAVAAIDFLNANDEKAWLLGEVRAAKSDDQVIINE